MKIINSFSKGKQDLKLKYIRGVLSTTNAFTPEMIFLTFISIFLLQTKAGKIFIIYYTPVQ